MVTAEHKRGPYRVRERTHCPWGHPYTPENTYWQPCKTTVSGVARSCRACQRERKRRRLAEQRAARAWIRERVRGAAS